MKNCSAFFTPLKVGRGRGLPYMGGRGRGMYMKFEMLKVKISLVVWQECITFAGGNRYQVPSSSSSNIPTVYV
jgi:hypothetical protein